MKPVIFYHANCTDGFGAAFAAWKVFGDDAEYVPVSYGQIKTADDVDLLGNIKDHHVFILDFSFPRPVMEYIFATAIHTTWLDHHKTAFEMWTPEEPFKDDSFYNITTQKHRIVLDNSRSGALIAWDFFHGGTVIPKLVLHIDDYDRWQFKNHNTKAFSRALRALKPWTFEQWNSEFLWVEHSERYQDVLMIGNILLDDHKGRVESAAKHAAQCTLTHTNYMETVHFAGLSVNASPDLSSDLGHELANKSSTFGLVYHIGQDRQVKCSLRSNGDYDVSAIAKRFGGGGHKNAAGFECTLAQLAGIIGA